MKKKIIYSTIMLITLTIINVTVANATTAKVSTETLNLRKEPSTSSAIIELLSDGEEIEVVSEENGWCKIKHGDNVGYVSKDFIKINEETESANNETTAEQGTDNVEETPSSTETTTPKATLLRETKVRILPIINSNEIGTLNTSETVDVLTKTNNWAFIQNDDITGWIPLIAVQEAKKEETTLKPEENEENEKNETPEIPETTNNTETTTTLGTKYIKASSVYVRSKPSTDSSILLTLIKNTDIKVTGEDGDWYKITFNDVSGYIRKDLVSDNKEETSRGGLTANSRQVSENLNQTSNVGNEIVNYAKQYLNCPYVYGASGSKSFDCSGFTMYVYKKFGVSLSHSATAQSKCGTYVSKENLQLGDLVFFKDYETMDGIGHCGIYIGDGNFIHASSGSGYCVKISTLLTGSYLNRYATARRLL